MELNYFQAKTSSEFTKSGTEVMLSGYIPVQNKQKRN